MSEKKELIETLRGFIESGPGWIGSWANRPDLSVKVSNEDWSKIEVEFASASKRWNMMWVLPTLQALERLEEASRSTGTK